MHEAIVAPKMLVSISTAHRLGTSEKCWPDCMTEPTETLATDCTVASPSLFNPRARRNLALLAARAHR
jgi:hypothetical protein